MCCALKIIERTDACRVRYLLKIKGLLKKTRSRDGVEKQRETVYSSSTGGGW